MGGELGIFPSPRVFMQGESYIRQLASRFTRCFTLLGHRAYTGVEARNVSKFQSLYGGTLGIVPRPRAFTQSHNLFGRRARNFSKSQGIYLGRKIYMTTRTSLRSSKSQGQSLYMVYIGCGSEFLQVPGPLYREKGVYDDSHLASLGVSLFQVPEPHILTCYMSLLKPTAKCFIPKVIRKFARPPPLL